MAPCAHSLGGPAVLQRAVQSRVDSQAPYAQSVRDLLSARGAPDFIHGSQGVNKLTASGAGGTLLTASGAGGTLRVDRQRGWRHVPTDPGQGERGRGHTGTRVCGLGTGHTVKRF